MSLQHNAPVDRILDSLNLGTVKRDEKSNPSLASLAYSSRYATSDIPKLTIPEDSIDARVAYQMVHDHLDMDEKPTLNCATFVGTWMEPEAQTLIMENLYKNFADQDEYPATQTLHARCVSIISHLWNIPDDHKAIGTATVGSSEGVMLGGLAMRRRWEERRKKEGKDIDRPNIILASCAQVALEKFANYFGVEPRLIPVTEESHHVLDAKKTVAQVDERTIGIYAILGSTYTGHYDPVEEISNLLDDLQKRTGLDIPIHVDAASGGFVAPFVHNHVKWGFDLPRVVSINSSGHKFGLCYPGVGWVLWKGEEYLPKSLVFELHYLGGTEKTYTLNFSRPSCFVIAQYYNFTRLGRAGYRSVISSCLQNSRLLSCALERMGDFEVLSDIHRKRGVFSGKGSVKEKEYNPGLPVVSFRLSKASEAKFGPAKQAQFAVSGLLKTRGWMIPNYSLPADEKETYILRMVVRENMSEDVVETFLRDLSWSLSVLEKSSKGDGKALSDAFSMAAGGMPEMDAEEASEEAAVKHRATGESAVKGKNVHKPNTYARVC